MLLQSKNFIPRRPSYSYIAIFIVCALCIVTVTFFSFKNQLTKPFKALVAEYEQSVRDNLRAEQEAGEKKLRELTADDDNDGISNYDETNRYSTSPYLADSDSDGLSDKYEIDTATDPLCPVGEQCQKSPNTLFANAPDIKTDATQYSSTDIEAMRKTLRYVPGIDLDKLASFSDEEIISAYEDFRSFTNEIKGSDLNQLFDQLGPDGVRAQLIEAGFAKEEVDSLSNDQLKELMTQALASLSG